MPAALRLVASVVMVGALASGQAVAQEARDWLARMSRAVDQLNYRGTFVHVLGGTAETLYVVHHNADGQSGERILSLEGTGREIVRRGDQVQGILPDQRIVLLETRSVVSPLVPALPSTTADLEPHYEITLGGIVRVADRSAQVLEIKPRDEFRYGYAFWLDQATGMPLQSQIVDGEGQIVEQILFTDIEVPAEVSLEALESTIDTEGFTLLAAPEATSLAVAIPWRAASVPGGFKLSVATQSPIAGSDTPVEHLVYSDGLATVSVFIEDPKTQAEVGEGFSSVGSTNAFSLTLRGRKVTAIGEVPRQTVRTIASSLVAE